MTMHKIVSRPEVVDGPEASYDPRVETGLKILNMSRADAKKLFDDCGADQSKMLITINQRIDATKQAS